MELRIEFRPGADPISGVVCTPDDATPLPFTGWMALVELIATALAEMDESTTETEQRH